MSVLETDCVYYGHIEGVDGICVVCDNEIGVCRECGTDTENVNLLCLGCNSGLLDDMDVDNIRLASQFGLSAY